MTGDEYVEAFGDVPEDDGYVTTALILPANMLQKAQKAAADSKINLSTYLGKLILKAENGVS